MSDYEIEPVPGLPEPLPPGETVLWQGAPSWRALAFHSFHVREIAVYFGVLLAWYAASTLNSGAGLADEATSIARIAGLASAATGLVGLYAFMVSRTTLYTVTGRRVVIRSGIALPTVVNIPFRSIASAGLKTFADRSGNIVLGLAPTERISYLVLWPNVRPWRLNRVEPTLRGIGDAGAAAQILVRALGAASPVLPQALPDAAWAGASSGAGPRSETATA
jgi:hypothetical protein